MKTRIIQLVIIAISFLPLSLLGQDIDDGSLKPYKGLFALTNATIHTVTNGVIQNGTVIINDGVIQNLGANITVPAGAEVIDCTGKLIYPGMIDGGTRLGIIEVNSVAETQDHQEIGNVKPHVKALTAVNPNSVAIPVTRVSITGFAPC